MTYIVATFTLLFGIILGSFLNVVIFRYNTGVGIRGRSKCMTCARTLRWYELIPVLSFISQGGKCRVCKSKLSWQYPFVELLTGFIFLGTFLEYKNTALNFENAFSLALMLIAWCLLVVILVYDMKHKIIPDGLVYAFAVVGLIKIFLFVPMQPLGDFLLALAAGPILFLPFFILWLVSGGRWIGLGDGKLALGIGWMLGMWLGLSAIVLAFWVGALVSLLVMGILRLKSRGKTLTMKSEIPFAPYLIIGFAIVYFFSIDVFGFYGLTL